jgi:Protein of unknown function (DUF2726)
MLWEPSDPNIARVRDDFVIGVCHANGLPLLQVPAQRAYAVAEVRGQLHEAIRAMEVAV